VEKKGVGDCNLGLGGGGRGRENGGPMGNLEVSTFLNCEPTLFTFFLGIKKNWTPKMGNRNEKKIKKFI
jgi:hypothetical protein